MQMPDALSRIHEVDVVDFESFDTTKDKAYHELIEKVLCNDPSASNFVLANDLLYKKLKRGNKEIMRLYIPTDRIDQALYECHDDKTASHGGFFKTRHRLRQSYTWPKMDEDIKKYLNGVTSANRPNRLTIICQRQWVQTERLHGNGRLFR